MNTFSSENFFSKISTDKFVHRIFVISSRQVLDAKLKELQDSAAQLSQDEQRLMGNHMYVRTYVLTYVRMYVT